MQKLEKQCMIRPTQQKLIQRMEKKYQCYDNFINSVSSDYSKTGYCYRMEVFMKFCVTKEYVKDDEDYPALLKLDSDQISDLLTSYVKFKEKKGTDSSTIINYLNAVELFFEMNRKIWHKKLVRRKVTKTNRVKAGKTPASDSDVFNMINARPQLRDKAIIHYIASTGCRPGSIIDPPLQFKHLIALPDIKGLEKFDFDPDNDEDLDIHQYEGKRFCYAIKIYDESDEGYWAFLIPAAVPINKMSSRVRTFAVLSARSIVMTMESPLVSSPMPGANSVSPLVRTLTSVPSGNTVSR